MHINNKLVNIVLAVVAVLTWRHTCLILKELREERGIGEVHVLGNLPNW